MRQGRARETDDPGFTHVYTHTVVQQLTGLQGGFLKDAKPVFFPTLKLKLSQLEFASRPAAVWSYSVTSIKNPPLASSLIKGVNNRPSLAVYDPLWQ